MSKKRNKRNKGISLISLAIAIIVIFIIAGMLIFQSQKYFKTKELNEMYSDIKVLKDSVETYYLQYNSLPIDKERIVDSNITVAIAQQKNPNDKTDEYYYIDLEALGDLTLYKDNYIINGRTHEIYNTDGVKVDGNIYYKYTSIASEITLNYTITYYLNGGTTPTDNPDQYDVDTDTFTLNNPTKGDSTFIGWTGSNGETPQIEVTIEKGSTGDRIYYANYVTNKYIVTFNGNGGTPSELEREVEYDTAIGTLPTATKEGYNLEGWFTESAGGTEITTDQTVTSDVTYYAHWTAKEYTITYNLDGGEVSTANRGIYTIETPAFTLNNPSKEGYTFVGWTGSNG